MLNRIQLRQNLNQQKMNLKNYVLMLAVASIVLVSCSEDDPKRTDKDGIIENQNDPDLEVGDLQGRITGDITLAANKNWILSGPLVVAGGGKLTLEAGTTIKAVAGGTNVFIAVERNGEIQAVGTAASPIKITSNAIVPAAGDWGGMLIMGNAGITGGVTAVTEVVDFIYGNNPANDTDDSGDIAYLILEYTGARINGEKEFNGLTLYGVGSGTNINNVAIFYGDDDAIEWFGGSVSVSNLLVVNATDDMFDYTQGWNGTLTNAYGIRELGYDEVSSDPRGIEGDGNLDGLTPGLSRQSNPAMNNITIVNNSTIANSGNSAMVDVIKVRRNSSGTFTNMLFIQGTDVPAPADFVDCTDTAGDAAGTTSINASATGANAAAVKTDVKPGANNATITVPVTDNTGCPTTIFAWTGYTF
jgi:hypothetical protein